MKIHINSRSEKELLAILARLGHSSPSHTVQTLITSAYKEIISIPSVEEPSINESSSTRKQQ